jgi:hypothetical protein
MANGRPYDAKRPTADPVRVWISKSRRPEAQRPRFESLRCSLDLVQLP